MAGKSNPQTTAAAPAPTPAPSVPAEVAATGNTTLESTSPPPPAPAPSKANGSKAPKVLAAPAPENAASTKAAIAAELEAAAKELEDLDTPKVQEGKAEKSNGKAPAPKAADEDKPKKGEQDYDPLQDELDAEQAKEEAAKVAKDEPAKAVDAEKEAEEVEPPDAEADKDVYEAWKKTLSKPAAKKIDQLERRAATAKAAAAERIVLAPTLAAPLSHVTTIEQLDAEKQYWTSVRDLARKGEPFTIKGTDGKKLELDPEIEEDAKVIASYSHWADAALDAVPDVKDRLKTRASSKPWEAAEKLAPGIVSDKESFAAKEAVKFLRSNPSLLNLPDYEVHVGHMVRSMQMDEDTKPTADFPSGRFKYFKVPLDKEGKIIRPKQAASKEKDAKRPPTASDSKPLMASTRNGNPNAHELYVAAEKSRSQDDLMAALKADVFG